MGVVGSFRSLMPNARSLLSSPPLSPVLSSPSTMRGGGRWELLEGRLSGAGLRVGVGKLEVAAEEEEDAEEGEEEAEEGEEEAEEEEEEEEVEASVGSGTSLDAKVAAVVVEAAEGGVAAVTVRASEAAPSSLGMAV